MELFKLTPEQVGIVDDALKNAELAWAQGNPGDTNSVRLISIVRGIVCKQQSLV